MAPLAPTNQRTKARYLNVDTLVNWVQKALTYLDSLEVEDSSEYGLKAVDEKLGWLHQYR